MKGRKPAPTVQRRLAGNTQRRPFNLLEPTPPAVDETFDTPPPDLDALPDAQREWRRLAPLLRRCRQITEADRAALLALCIEWAAYLEARAHAYPRVVRAPSGYAMPNPWLGIRNRALAACLKLWPELGLTPSSRSRVSAVAPGGAADDFAEFDAPDATTTPVPPSRPQ